MEDAADAYAEGDEAWEAEYEEDLADEHEDEADECEPLDRLRR